MKKYILLTLIVCFVVISYIAQEEEQKKEDQTYECWDGQEHWFAPIYHMLEMTDPAFWEAYQEAVEREQQQQAELNARDS